MSHPLFAALALGAHLAAILRLLTYRRHGAQHRRHVSWFAWACLVMLGGSAIELILTVRQLGLFDAGRAILLSLFVLGVRGNVARIFKRNNDE